jgi:enterobactin synthetase component D
MIAEVLFDLTLEHGRCVGIRIPEDIAAVDALGATGLAPEEVAFAAGLAPIRRRTWVGGRVALRLVLTRAGLHAPAVLPDARGAPILPDGIAGSISHKGHLAAALVATRGELADRWGAFAGARVGVDVEVDVVGRIDVSSHVLAADEATELAGLATEARAREVLLRFSVKESIYKALDPFVRRYVAFQEVSVSPEPEGGARVTSRLRAGEGPFSFDARWRRLDGIVLTSARVAYAPAR